MSALPATLEAWVPQSESEREWVLLKRRVTPARGHHEALSDPTRHLLGAAQRGSGRNTLRQLARWLVAETDVSIVAGITRTHVEDYKVWLAAQPGHTGPNLAKNTQRQRLRMIRIFFERLIEWDWDDAPRRNPIFHGDIPPRTDPLPKFLTTRTPPS